MTIQVNAVDMTIHTYKFTIFVGVPLVHRNSFFQIYSSSVLTHTILPHIYHHTLFQHSQLLQEKRS